MFDSGPKPSSFLSALEAEERLKWRLAHPKKYDGTRFSKPEDLLKGFWKRSGVAEDRMAILGAIWDKETGAFRTHWKLDGVKAGTLHVRVKSSASGQELALRSRELIRTLNKHFMKAWIKAIRFKVGPS